MEDNIFSNKIKCNEFIIVIYKGKYYLKQINIDRIIGEITFTWMHVYNIKYYDKKPTEFLCKKIAGLIEDFYEHGKQSNKEIEIYHKKLECDNFNKNNLINQQKILKCINAFNNTAYSYSCAKKYGFI